MCVCVSVHVCVCFCVCLLVCVCVCVCGPVVVVEVDGKSRFHHTLTCLGASEPGQRQSEVAEEIGRAHV